MEKIINIFKNVKRGPVTSFLGAICIAFPLYLAYELKALPDLMSFDAAMFSVGVGLLVSPDIKAGDGKE